MSEGPSSGEVYDTGEPVDDPPEGEIDWRGDLSAT
jgi:hypothetical protein